MKVFKPRQCSILIKNFGLEDRLHLACTVLIFFDLKGPDLPLTEQDLWEAVPKQLGQSEILDAGMPKPRVEALVAGKCFAPKGKTVRASEVSFRVGAVEKRLSIFGDRHWKTPSASGWTISDPAPFSEMPIIWPNAFGGEGFESNPVGKGIKSVMIPGREALHPLPNIEHPDRLIGAPFDRPEPAGFGPIEMMRPVRYRKQGTYDQKWQLERWPYFPADMNYEFFNTASEDQMLDGFFQGNETIQITNMHPDMPVIDSRLPGIRPRCFVTKRSSLQSLPGEDEVFEEVRLHIDTVWLFPEILRGVVMHRGTCRILDEEFADLSRIFVSAERRDAAPETIQHYLEEQRKVLNRTVTIDPAPFEAAKQKIADTMKRVEAIPKDLDDAKKRALGKSPKMRRTPEEIAAGGKRTIADAGVMLSEMELLARRMQREYGHLVTIPAEGIRTAREKLDNTGRQIDSAMAGVRKAQSDAENAKNELTSYVRDRIPAEYLAEAPCQREDFLKPASVDPWHDRSGRQGSRGFYEFRLQYSDGVVS